MNKDNEFYIQACCYSFVIEYNITYDEFNMCLENPRFIRILGLKKFFEDESNKKLPIEFIDDLWFVLCLE